MNSPDQSNDAASSTGAKRRRKWLWPTLILILAAGSASAFLVNFLSPPPAGETIVEAPSPRAMRLNSLEIETVQVRSVEDLVKVTGTIHPAQEAAIAAQVSGLAETVAVRPGDRVDAGQLLVELGTLDLQLQLDEQRSTMASNMVQLRAAQATLERTKNLFDKGLAAQTVLEAAQADVEQLAATVGTQKSQVAHAEANLLRARVLAPFSGIVATRDIEPGQSVAAGTPMLSIVDLSTVRVEMVAALKHAARIEAGQSARLTIQGLPGRDFKGIVDRISPVAEPGTRSIKVYLSLDNADGTLRGGMFVTGEIVLQRHDKVLAVPAEAIHRRDGTSFVLMIVDGVVRENPVESGESWPDKDLVEIRSGIAAGDVIVAESLEGLAGGTAVVIEKD